MDELEQRFREVASRLGVQRGSPNPLGKSERFVATRSFSARDIPGYEGENEEFEAGLTWVGASHAAVQKYPQHFARGDSRSAERAVRSAQGGSKAAAQRVVNRQTPRVELRSDSPSPPWWEDNEPSPTPAATPQRHRRTPDEPYSVRGVSWSLGDPGGRDRELRDKALRAIEADRDLRGREDLQSHLADLLEARDGVGDIALHLLQTGSQSYREHFTRAISGHLISDEEKRSLSLNGPSGGYLLPYVLDPTIVPTSNGVRNPIRAMASTRKTTEAVWKGVTAEGIEARYEGEGTEATESEPKFGQPEVETHKADAYIEYDFAVGQDRPDLEEELTRLFARAKDEKEASALLSGSGEGEPTGVLTAAASKTVETATKAVFAAADLDTVEQALPAGFRANAQWLGNGAIFKQARKFPTEGAPLWVRMVGMRGNLGAELDGYPANELSTMAATTNGGELILVLGDFDYFVVVDRIGMAVKRIENVLGEHQRPAAKSGLYAFWRNGSNALTPKAFQVLKVKAS